MDGRTETRRETLFRVMNVRKSHHPHLQGTWHIKEDTVKLWFARLCHRSVHYDWS